MSFPSRVLLITDRYPPHPGGLARSSQRLAGHAAEGGASVQVLVLRGEGAPGTLASCRDGGIRVHRIGAGRDPAACGQFAAQAIEWLHRSERFELLHGQYGSTAGFMAAYQGRLLGVPSYVSLRGNDLDRDVYDPARFGPLSWALAHADAVGAVSRALAGAAAALTGREDIRYTPNSVDGNRFRPLPTDAALRASLGLEDGEGGPVIGFAGELRQKKGARFLLDAFRAVSDLGARLLLVGTVRAEESRLLEQLRLEEPELAGRIRRCGYLDDPAELAAAYNAMDVAVFPSLCEGMPNAVLEAMACGRPVLASDAGGIPDVLVGGETGWLISRHELHRLGEALREVLELPPAERAAVGERARARVLREFPPDRERQELAEAYAAAVARAASAAHSSSSR